MDCETGHLQSDILCENRGCLRRWLEGIRNWQYTFDIHNMIKQMIIICLELQYHCAMKIFLEANIYKYVTQVQLQDTSATKSNGQANELNTWVPCKNGDAATEGTNTVEIICDERLAAKEVRIQFAGGSTLELAEVVVVGKPWGKLCFNFLFSS